ncbi:50S ribosomal protein L18 [Candidatus Karelsulcia muelleri]|uniref:Large ribosomal subunit protein uL18 n=1 Tax=Candidatus Karelsulcia muelleri PSPU TaxID=1189303 RepID=A0AAD1EY67_9FLAO|nr:50S ribosomal protein L18 [Candidatus Karelsulcia muelleri]NJJ98750.1 50S ribosomal protein L18 [Candidatus Karelsulcia muelleri]BAO66402.1 50S ribosomal protein L18 [Candidatus Karelsulcia muelleri PSPU]
MNKKRRKDKIINKIFGFLEKPRISIFLSNKHIYAQVIDDYKGHTLIYTSSKEIRYKLKKEKKSFIIGQILGNIVNSYGITKIVFDRNGYIYHGRVKALAEGLRNVGLQF